MEFEKIDILDLLPQRPPFVLIDRLVHFDEHWHGDALYRPRGAPLL